MIRHYIISMVKQYGNIGIVIGLMLEFFGIPVPGETLLSFIGYLSINGGNRSLVVSVTYAVIGTNIGSIIAYFIGKKYGEGVLIRFGRFLFITKEKLDKAEKRISKNRITLLLFSRFLPGLRHVTPYLSGMSNIRTASFLIYNFLGSIIWCIFFVALGSSLGKKWAVIERIVKSYFVVIVLIGAFVFVVVKYFNTYKKTIFIIVFPMLLFIKLSEDLIRKELTVFDNMIYGFVSSFISNNMTFFMKFITNFGSPGVLIFFAAALYIILKVKRKSGVYGNIIVMNLFSVWVLNEIFKMLFHRARPDIFKLTEVYGYSFPSGHSMVSVSFYGMLIYFCYKKIHSRRKKAAAVSMLSILVFFIGISRIYLGAHYASDVLAGFSAGIAWLAIFIVFVNKYYINPKKSTGPLL